MIFIAGGIGFFVGYIFGYGTVITTLRAVEKIVDKEQHFSFSGWLQPQEEGGLIEPDKEELFKKAETLEDLLK